MRALRESRTSSRLRVPRGTVVRVAGSIAALLVACGRSGDDAGGSLAGEVRREANRASAAARESAGVGAEIHLLGELAWSDGLAAAVDKLARAGARELRLTICQREAELVAGADRDELAAVLEDLLASCSADGGCFARHPRISRRHAQCALSLVASPVQVADTPFRAELSFETTPGVLVGASRKDLQSMLFDDNLGGYYLPAILSSLTLRSATPLDAKRSQYLEAYFRENYEQVGAVESWGEPGQPRTLLVRDPAKHAVGLALMPADRGASSSSLSYENREAVGAQRALWDRFLAAASNAAQGSGARAR